MANYFVPNLGPSVYMSPVTEAWAERTGKKVERKEFPDVEAAKVFALSIFSRVEDEKAVLIWDARKPTAIAPDSRSAP